MKWTGLWDSFCRTGNQPVRYPMNANFVFWIMIVDLVCQYRLYYIFNYMKTPIEAFFKNWEVHGLNPSVLIPKNTSNGLSTFSAFVVLIKNDICSSPNLLVLFV